MNAGTQGSSAQRVSQRQLLLANKHRKIDYLDPGLMAISPKNCNQHRLMLLPLSLGSVLLDGPFITVGLCPVYKLTGGHCTGVLVRLSRNDMATAGLRATKRVCGHGNKLIDTGIYHSIVWIMFLELESCCNLETEQQSQQQYQQNRRYRRGTKEVLARAKPMLLTQFSIYM